ncbi:MAG: 4Fe-4S dicluster domain-containing protein [Oscillospiraceae bacterium]|nr:4Fe-4S dicluster domain-containing protein [Oscillospiraceae bacterium]
MTYLGEDIKKLGFGLMRLPMIGDEVDLPQTKEMVDLFLKSGFTYFDTAYGYLNGKSEAAVKEALVDRYPRESFQLATKLPAWAGAANAEEARQMFFTSLERTGAGYFDFYLLHNLGDNRTEAFDRFDIWNFAREQKEKGLIKHLGFSFHDKADVLDAVLTAHPEMEFVQLQINYADWDSPSIQSRACLEVAQKHGKPVIIMEPVKGGALANLPVPAAEILKAANPNASLPSWAIRYAASLPGVITVLSGMSTIGQMEDNLATMADFAPLSDKERETVAKVQQVLKDLPQVPCTDCRYCVKGCPQQINIPGIFKAMNTLLVYNNPGQAQGDYNWGTREGGKASACIGCGQCEAACPQHIQIIGELKRAAETFEK